MDEEHVTCTQILLLLYLLAFSILSIFGIFYLIFSQVETYIYAMTGFVTLMVIVFFIVLGLIKWLVEYLQVSKQSSKEKDLIDMKVGYGIIFVLGLVPRILILFVEPSYAIYVLLYGCIVYPLVCAATHTLFLMQLGAVYTFDWKKKEPLSHTVGFVSGVLMFLSIPATIIFVEDRDIEGPICLYQMIVGLIAISTDIEFAMVSRGGIKLKDEPVSRTVKPQTPASVAPVVSTDPRLECKICLLPYSTAKIPRILGQCGHTVCEGCANQLLDKNARQFVFCPLCQVVTVVKGPASLLAKNHMVLDFIKESMDSSK